MDNDDYDDDKEGEAEVEILGDPTRPDAAGMVKAKLAAEKPVVVRALAPAENDDDAEFDEEIIDV